jgi:hypothetical protein
MELLQTRCCGLDVHKETVVACPLDAAMATIDRTPGPFAPQSS